MVGFNRRFSPLLVEMRARFGRSTEPTNARYLVNAGRLASDSWYRDNELEGSRFVGEGGHFVDTMSWWMGSDPVEVMTTAAGGPDEVQVSLRYGDGSLATITYLTSVHRRFPKETFEVSSGGRTARLDNFKRTTVWAGPRARVRRHLGAADKGQGGRNQGVPGVRAHRWRDAHLPGLAGGDDPRHPCHRSVDRGTRRAAAAMTLRCPSPTGRRHRWTMNSVELEWRLRRLSKMSASEVRWRISEHVRRKRWASRQIMPEFSPQAWALDSPSARRGTVGFGPRRVVSAVSVQRGPAGGPGRRPSERDCGGRRDTGRAVGAPRCPASGHGGPGLVLRSVDRNAGASGRLLLQGQSPIRGRHGKRQADLGALSHAPPDGARGSLQPLGRRALCRRAPPPISVPGGHRTPFSPACTGRAGSRRGYD